MLALGCVLAGAGVLLVALLALLFRHPRAPHWTELEIVAMLMSVPVTGLIGFGLGYVLTGGYWLLHGVGNALELLAPVGLALVLVPTILPLRRRLKSYAANTNGPTLVSSLPETTLSIDGPPRPPAPARPPRKAA